MLSHHHREHPKHITINSEAQVSTINSSSSPGYLPPVNPPRSSNQTGFLYRYNTGPSRTQDLTFAQSTSATPSFTSQTNAFNSANYGNGFNTLYANSMNSGNYGDGCSTSYANTMNSANYGDGCSTPYANCFSDLQKELQRQKCSPMNFQEICNSCCSPQKPVCSEDPNCFMFKECRKNVLGQTCKYLQNRGPRLPSWLAHCGRVLIFDAYFQEPVPESNIENYRIRIVNIRYYMDDGTVDVYEPKTLDSGIDQGRLIRRHRIPLPAPADMECYTMEDFNVGCEVEMYGKTFLICGCNEPTRRYLNKLGITVPPNMIMPEDPYTNWRKSVGRFCG